MFVKTNTQVFTLVLGKIFFPTSLRNGLEVRGLDLERNMTNSVLHIKNRRGPSTEPWGTPCLIDLRFDSEFWIDTNWCLSDKYDLNQFLQGPLIPQYQVLMLKFDDQPYQRPFEDRQIHHRQAHHYQDFF